MRRIFSFIHLLNLFAFFPSLLLLISLTITPAGADSGSQGNRIDVAKDMIIRHMNIMGQESPEIKEKVRQVQEELSSGVVSPRETCSKCHVKEGGHP